MLSIRNLSKIYPGGITALSEVALHIPPDMYGLLGPNGAGKSTLMRTPATLQTPDAGSIELDGTDVLAQPEWLRGRLGYLPQEFGAYPRTSPEVMLAHLAVLKDIPAGERKPLIEHLLTRTNLWEVRKQNIDTFSGGMRQRFGIAQALMGEPRLIIVDEPTAGLDPVERRRFQNLLSQFSEEQMVLLSTRIVADVADLCPRMAILCKGRVLAEGGPEVLIESLEGRLWHLKIKREELSGLAARHHVLSTRNRAGALEAHILEDQQPAGPEPVQPGLEDVYLATLEKAGIDTGLNDAIAA
ncbi:MAG: ABC transporter ATP-binding protein [Gammaproteobacteria bacterium]|nr:ABC transporter ATP-binding protein [Gammaproteobacteria bacterium]